MSDLVDMLRDVPPLLAAAWGGWLAVGLILLLWHLRSRGWERESALLQAEARRATRAALPALDVRRPGKTPPIDAFGELEALLEPSPSADNVSHRPGN